MANTKELRAAVKAAQDAAPKAPPVEPELPPENVPAVAPQAGALVTYADALSEDAGAGFEDVAVTDIALPFWKIAQGLSPQCQSGDPLYIPGLRPGHWFDVINSEFCDEFDFVPCRVVTHYIEWGPQRGDGMIANHGKDRSVFERCYRDAEKGRWVLPDSGNVVVPTPTWFGIVVSMTRRGEEYLDENRKRRQHLDTIETGLMRRAVLTLTGTAEKISRRWVADAASIKVPRINPETGIMEKFQNPLYGMTYRVGSTSTKNAKGTWHSPTIARAGWTLSLPHGEEVFREAKEFHHMSQEIRPAVLRAEDEDGVEAPRRPRNGVSPPLDAGDTPF